MNVVVRAIIVIAAGLLLGVGGRLLLGTGDEPSPLASSSVEAPRAVESGEAISSEPRASTPSHVGDLAAALAERIAALPVPDPGGEFVIEGSVLDARGAPLPGVVVRASPIGAPPGHDATSANIRGGDLEKYIVDRVAEHRFRHSGRETVSDERGDFRLAGLAAVAHTIEARRAGTRFECRASDEQRAWAYPGERVELRVDSAVAVPVAVRYPDGRAPAKAFLHIGSDRSNESFEWNPDSPQVTLEPGSYTFSARIDGWSSPRTPADVRPEGADPITLELVAQSGIALEVEIPAGEGPDRIVVFTLAIAPGEEPSAERLLRNGESATVFRKATFGGRVEHPISSLPPARYAVGIGRTEGDVEAIGVATVGEGFTELVIALPEARHEDWIEVVAFGPDGRPLDEFTCYPIRRTAERNIHLEHAVVARTAGVRHLILASGVRSRIDAGEWEFEVMGYAAGLAPASALVIAGRAELRFAPLAQVTFVVSAGGGDAPDLHCYLIDASGDVALESYLVIPETPAGEVAVGTYEVQLAAFGEEPIPPFRVNLVEGENLVRIDLPAGHTLEVESAETWDDAVWELYRIDGRAGREQWGGSRQGSVEDGVVRFAGVYAGDYSLLFRRSGGMAVEVQTVRIDRDLRIRFEGRPLRAFRVRVFDERNTGGFDVRDGDLIVGANELEFATAQDLVVAIEYHASAEDSTILIERDGVGRISVPAPIGGFQEIFYGGSVQLVPVARD